MNSIPKFTTAIAIFLSLGCGPSSATTSDESTGTEGCDELVWVAEPGNSGLEVESLADAEALPPYTRIEGRLVVLGAPGLVDLRFLECLEFASEMAIVSLPDLTSLAGLERLETVDDDGQYVGHDLDIRGNPRLEDLDGLRNLKRAGGLTVSNNATLESLDGLQSLESAGEIWITENPSLETIGLRALQSGDVHIGWIDCSTNGPVARGNPGLIQIDGLDVLSEAVKEVSGNPNLLSIEGLPDIGEWTSIELNASLPYADVVALDDVRSGEFLTCGNLDEPEPCICPPGNPP